MVGSNDMRWSNDSGRSPHLSYSMTSSLSLITNFPFKSSIGFSIVFEIFRELRGVRRDFNHTDDDYNVYDSEDTQQVSE